MKKLLFFSLVFSAAALAQAYSASLPAASAPAAQAGFAHFVTDPEISVLLLSIGLLGIAVEIVTQHGVAGGVGLVSLGCFFAGHLMTDPSDVWYVALFFAGIGLMLVELHVLPGHGVSGILGVLSVLASLFLALGGSVSAAKELSFSLAIALVVFVVLLRYLPKAPLFSKLILKAEVATPFPVRQEIADDQETLRALVGKGGTTASELRPSGIVLIESKRYSAMAEGEFIPRDTAVRVSGLQGSTLVVSRQA